MSDSLPSGLMPSGAMASGLPMPSGDILPDGAPGDIDPNDLPTMPIPLPALPYEPGTPEYESWASEDKGPTSLALCWTFVALATLFTIARLYTRLGIQRKLRSDDYWNFIGLVMAYLATIFTTVAVSYGTGKHYQLLTMNQQEKARLFTLCAFIPSVMAFCLPKFGVVALLCRLTNPSKQHRWFMWAMCITLFLSLIGAIGLLLGQCKPVSVIWDMTKLPEMECIDPKIYVDYSIYCGAISAFIDFYLAIYPAFVLWKLQMRTKKKVILSLALSLGIAGGALAIYKTNRFPEGIDNPDFSYVSADLVNWTILEGCAIIIAATVPVLAPLMDKILKHRNPFGSSRKYAQQGGSNGSSGGHASHKYGKGGSACPNCGHGGNSSARRSMQQRANRKNFDPFDPEMDLAETLMVNSSEDLSLQKKHTEDLEAQLMPMHHRGSSGSAQTKVAHEDDEPRFPSFPQYPLSPRPNPQSRYSGQTPSEGIMRTREVDVQIQPNISVPMASPTAQVPQHQRRVSEQQEKLDKNIPWETPVPSPAAPQPQQSSHSQANQAQHTHRAHNRQGSWPLSRPWET